MNIPATDRGEAGASIHFSDGRGGGGGGKSKEISNFRRSEGARRKFDNVVCLVVFLC